MKILVGKYYIIKEFPVSLSLEAGTDAVDIETIQKCVPNIIL